MLDYRFQFSPRQVLIIKQEVLNISPRRHEEHEEKTQQKLRVLRAFLVKIL